jgi:hypothetical protein
MLLASTSLLLNSAREIKFKVRKRVARVARFMRFHCCGCNLILEFRSKKTATELRHRRDFDLALQFREGLCDRWSMQQLDRPRNRTQFDGALPITLKAARQVGDILKYVPDGTTPDPRYPFYM